jgi:catechol 2,3-dioxygenase-like lactoylglutathione lyase family enzyme
MAATSINHVSIHARDLDESVAFYERLFGMRRIPTPNSAFPVQWLQLGDQQLHLFVRPGAQAPTFHLRLRDELIPLSASVPQPGDALRATLFTTRRRNHGSATR